jgi:hypothetical protein
VSPLQIKGVDGQVRSFKLDEEGRTIDPYDQWEAEFKPLLGESSRWEAFKLIVADQLSRDRPVIVEAGTLRRAGNWDGDGCSTLVWDWILKHKPGRGVSVDIDMKAVQLAGGLCEKMQTVCYDSVSFLRAWNEEPTLVYLDSCDYPEDLTTRINACMHQAAELGAIWSRVPSGCLIASDDSFDADNGKPAITRRILAALGIQPILDSYVVIWKKP